MQAATRVEPDAQNGSMTMPSGLQCAKVSGSNACDGFCIWSGLFRHAKRADKSLFELNSVRGTKDLDNKISFSFDVRHRLRH